MTRLVNKIKIYITDKFIALGVIRGNIKYDKFIILSDYRSGSNLLMNLIKSHPQALCYSELFYGKKYFGQAKYMENRKPTVKPFLLEKNFL
jgi:hypothetical protein